MKQIGTTNLYVGDITSSAYAKEPEWAVVHATQTIHYEMFGWDRKAHKPPKDHPNYIEYEADNILSLNWVDGAASIYEYSSPQVFVRVMNFIDKWYQDRKIMIHCDQGQSRSPTLALLYLAKRHGSISNSSFLDARKDFVQLYAGYSPGGIAQYVSSHWNEIN